MCSLYRTLTKAENSAQHPYDFCDNDDNEAVVASIMLPCLFSPWESATHLSTGWPSLHLFVPHWK